MVCLTNFVEFLLYGLLLFLEKAVLKMAKLVQKFIDMGEFYVSLTLRLLLKNKSRNGFMLYGCLQGFCLLSSSLPVHWIHCPGEQFFNVKHQEVFLSPRSFLEHLRSFVRSFARPQEKSKSHLQPYKSSKEHARPLI